jgi:hypothetical protein
MTNVNISIFIFIFLFKIFHIGQVNRERVSALGKTQYTIKDLVPDATYGVRVQAESLTTQGPVSLMVTGQPTNNGTYCIPSSPAYGVSISQLIRYARACSTYDQF